MMVVFINDPYFSSFKDLSVSLTILIIPGLLYYEKVKSSVKRFEIPVRKTTKEKLFYCNAFLARKKHKIAVNFL